MGHKAEKDLSETIRKGLDALPRGLAHGCEAFILCTGVTWSLGSCGTGRPSPAQGAGSNAGLRKVLVGQIT